MIEALLESDKAELTQNVKKGAPVVLSTRLRLARNMNGFPFPERANSAHRSDVMSACAEKLCQ